MAAHLRVVPIAGKGRGVLAGRRFTEGEVIDEAPVVVVPSTEWPLVEQTTLSQYCFTWDEDTEEAAVALGHGSFVNHSYSPNAYCVLREEGPVMEFVALRDIEEGEEITINYTGEPEGRDPVGFEVVDDAAGPH